MLNLMAHFGGQPLSCYGTVWQQGRPITREDVYEGNEGIGPLAGDEVHATYRLESGTTGYFDSVRSAEGKPSRFGLQVFGSAGIIQMFSTGPSPSAFFLPDSSWSPGRTKKQWIPITANGIGVEESPPDTSLHAGNVLAVMDLIAAIEEGRPPTTNINDSLQATEMIVAVFESQRLGHPVRFPLKNRQNPLAVL
jgi:predicted dehydrogenase